MAESKYKILKGKTGKTKKVVIKGVKKVLYKKTGSQKLYVMSKGRMINLVKYKKMKAKKAKASPKKKNGGTGLPANLQSMLSQMSGGAKKSRKPKKAKKPRKSRK